MTKRKIKTSRLAGIGLAVMLVVGLLYVILKPETVAVETAVAALRPFEEVLRTDGYMRALERYVVPSPADGDIKRVDLRVGDPVKKGQVLTEIFWDVSFVPIKAPMSGVISKINRESAGPIRRGEPIVEIIDPSRLEAVAELLTADAARLKPGLDVRIEGWGEATPIPAKVVRVSQAGFTKLSALGVEEERTEVVAEPIALSKDTMSKLGHNFHVELSFVIHQEPQALTIPLGAVFRDGERWAVYRVSEERAERTWIQIERRGQNDVMISEGLAPGDPVIMYPGDLVHDGSRVRVR